MNSVLWKMLDAVRRRSREPRAICSTVKRSQCRRFKQRVRGHSRARVLSISYAISTIVTEDVLHSTCRIDVEPEKIVSNATTTMSTQVRFNEQIINSYKFFPPFPNNRSQKLQTVLAFKHTSSTTPSNLMAASLFSH